MARRRVAQRRDILPDPIYNSTLVTKFINGMMWAGKKSVAEEIFYGAMEKIGEKTGEEPLKIFKKAVDTVAPTLEVKSRRIGGATYQVRSKSQKIVATRSRSAGSFRTREAAARRRCVIASSVSFLIRHRDAAERLRRRTTSTAWQKRTRRSHIIDFSRWIIGLMSPIGLMGPIQCYGTD
jgi:small subunit ribosomal protein S7